MQVICKIVTWTLFSDIGEKSPLSALKAIKAQENTFGKINSLGAPLIS
jgi:hypothetical protein